MHFSLVSDDDETSKAETSYPGTLRSRAPFLGIAAGILAFALIAAGAFVSIGRLQNNVDWVEHTYKVLMSIERSVSLLKDAQSSVRIYTISGFDRDLALFSQSRHELDEEQKVLGALIGDNASQQVSKNRLRQAIDRYLQRLDEAVKLRVETGNPLTAASYVTSEDTLARLDDVRRLATLMESEETALLTRRADAVDNSALHSKRLILFGTLGACLILASALLLLIKERRQRREAEQGLLEANQVLTRHANQLETTNRELDSFSYSISHDLRIPLRAVSGYARMVEEDYADKLDDEGRRLLTVIRENSRKMNSLIDDLLSFSRLGRKKIAASKIDMNELVTAAVNELRGRQEYASAHVEIQPLPPAWGDRALLQQVWINLISNALKYSSVKEHPFVRIAASSTRSEHIYSVSDNGVGFDMQYYDKLFGVFQRLHSQEQFTGTGVGLAIVQRIVVRHGGRVWAEGKPGEGAVFYFSLPSGETNAIG